MLIVSWGLSTELCFIAQCLTCLREVHERNVHAVLSYIEDPQPLALWLLLLDQQICFLQVWNWKLLIAAQELKITLLPNTYIVFHLANGCFLLLHGSKVKLKLKSLYSLILLGFPFIQLPKHKYWVGGKRNYKTQ